MIWLLFAHFIGDWAIQPEWIATNKGKYWFVMLSHCIIWTACVCIGLEYIGCYALWKVLFLISGHYLVDLWKCKLYEKIPFCQQKTYKHLYIDQLIHIIQVIFVGVL